MSFDLFFQPCSYKPDHRKGINPFTKKEIVIKSSASIEQMEVQKVQAILSENNAVHRDKCYTIDLPDGGSAEIFSSDLAGGCMMATRNLSPELLKLIVSLLQAANWAMLPASEDSIAIVSSSAKPEQLPAKYPRLVTCDSADDLGLLLKKGFNTWQQYRNQVI